MSKQILISMLKQGNDGNEILAILDVIAGEESVSNDPTLEEIQF